jgi:diguanylate cyclase (GGDEF)-like protein
MEIKKPNLSFDYWRKKIIHIFFLNVALLFAIEVMVYFALRNHGLLSPGTSDLEYIIKYIVTPTVLCSLLVFLCYRINKKDINEQAKNYAVLITVSVLTGVIAFIHYIIGAILTIFVIPVFLTILFSRKRITTVITLLNAVLLALSSIHSLMYVNNIFSILNIVVAYSLLIAAYLLSTVLIAYNRSNHEYINASYRTQLSLKEQARVDSLTGLYNQKTFQTLLQGTLAKAKDMKFPMSLAIIDLDGFKEINDTFGHLEGDQVLTHFTELFRQQCGDGEALLSRCGGDEFAVIFPRISKEHAFSRMEALRQSCRHVPHTKIRSGGISFSAGISHFAGGDMNETLLFHQADSALYQAKENGKGQTIVYQE